MRYYLILLFLCVNLILSGATYYVAPNGSDSNSGSITLPFLTLNKAWTVVTAGDIIYMRGGTYQYGTTMNVLSDKSGTSSNPIKIWAYPGEYPVIDYAGVNLTGQKIGLRLHNINYVYFKGIRICNMAQQNISNAWPNYGIILYDDVNNCTFEQMEVDHIGGTGFTIADRCSNNLFLNCDSHHHQDPFSAEPYGMSDGFESGSHGANTSTNNTFRNCRSWSNSDDGWDFRQADGIYTIDGCWSFRNGFIPGTTTTGGNGDGYKLGGKTTPATNVILRTIKNSLAFENRATGITPEPDASDNVFGLDIYNCTSYKNARDLGEGINTGNYNNYTRVRNCVSYANIHSNVWMQGGAVHDHNSWDIPKSVTDADFISVNSTGADGQRQADGSLPSTNFLHLVAGSGLIDCGTDVGQTCVNTPDLGAFEYQSVTPPPSPVYISSSTENATPSLLEMTYSLSLAAIIPSSSAFLVTVNSVPRAVNSVAITGTKIQLTLSGPVIYGDVVKVSYTKPSSNPIQSGTGGQALTLAAQSVTNNVSAVSPVYVSSAIQNSTPSLLEMTYSLTLANIVPAASSFSVMVNSVSRAISSVTISASKVQLTLSDPVVYGDVVTVSYTKPSTNSLQTPAGGQAASNGAQAVTNNVIQVKSGYYYVSPSGSDSNPGTITLPFFTLNKAWSVVAAGNTVYVRGGTYHYGTSMSVLADKSGTSSNIIKIQAYPGESPVIDYSGVILTGQKMGLRLHNINYVSFKGIRICNIAQENISNAWADYGVILYDDVNNCTFEQIEVDHIGGTGFTIADRCSNNLFLNCDSHHNEDPHSSSPYDMADGFESGSHGLNSSTNNIFRNCRAWSNSDDGWDLGQADGVYTIENCWSFRNGFIPGTSTSGGNGNGFKIGGKTAPGTSSVLRTIKGSLAFENRATGITPEPDAADQILGIDIINCTAYKNAKDLGEGINTGNYNNYARVRNCISYANLHSNVWMQAGAVNDHNSWDIPKTVTDADFISVSSSGADGARQADGSLPVTSFLHLAANSGLIDAGVNSGLTYFGLAPDLGAFETQISNSAPVTSILTPAQQSTFKASSNIMITASATDPDGYITLVEFYNGSVKLGSVTASPYTFSWNNVAAGTYSLTVIATDNQNGRTVSSPVSVTVTARNRHPYISIANPLKGSTYENLSTVTISAIATDPDGIITKVEFYNGTMKIAELSSAPYLFDWKDIAPGTYSISAIATDNSNDTTLSETVQFVIKAFVKETVKNNESARIDNLYPNPSDGHFSVQFTNSLQDEKSELTITDITGRKVFSGLISQSENLKSFDFSQLKSGIYVMMVKDKQQILTRKFIIK